MRKLLALLLFALLTTTANAQFRLASDGLVFNTSVVNDSTFIVDVNIFADLTGSGYIPTNIIVGYRMFSQRGQLYRINAIANATFSSATFTIIEVDNAQVNTEGLPIGQIQIYDPGTVEAIPQVPFGTTGATAVLQAAVVSYNSILPGGSEAVVDLALVRGIVNDSVSVERSARVAAINAIDTTKISLGTSSVRVFADSITASVNNQNLFRWRTLTGGRESFLGNYNQNYIDPTNTGQAWVSGGTAGTSTRTFGTSSWNGKSANQLIGDNNLRSIFGGYDNTIGPVLASTIFGSHHSAIEFGAGGGGHNTIVGGSNSFIDGGGYVGIFAGTQNVFRGGGFAVSAGSRQDSLSGEFIASIASDSAKIEGDEFNVIIASKNGRIFDASLYNTMFSSFESRIKGLYNVVSGTRNEAYGSGNYVGGATNTTGALLALKSYNLTHGTFNTVTSEHSATMGQGHTVSGGHHLVSGETNIVSGTYNFTSGNVNGLLANYGAGFGRNIQINSDYSWAGGRNNTIAASSLYSSIISGVNLTNARTSTALAQNIEVKEFYYDRRGEAGNNDDVLTKDAAGTDWKAPGTIVVINPTGGVNTLQEALNDIDALGGSDNLGNHTATQDLDLSGFKATNIGLPTATTDAARLQEIVGTQATATDADLILSTTAPKQQVTLFTTTGAVNSSDAAIPPPTSGRAGYEIIVTSAAGAGATFANRITSIGTDIRLLSGVDVNAIVIPYDRTYTVTCKDVGAGIYRWILDVGDDPSAFTGWADYSDNQYTVGSPLLLTANVKRTLPNNAATTVDTQKPIDVATFYTSADSTITGRNGDGVNIMVEFVAVPTSVAATFLDIAIDIGGAVGEIYPNTLSFPKGVGVARNIIYHISGYTLGTWEANGGKVKVISDGPVSVYNIRYVVTRAHKAR